MIPAPPMWRVVKEGEMTCPASLPVTIGSPGRHSQAALFCDLTAGHDTLHYDSTDHVWWRPGDDAPRA